MSVLTTCRALAETWGPTWLVPAGNSHPEYYRQITIGTGRIIRSNEDTTNSIDGAVSCHWEFGTSPPRTFTDNLPESALIPKRMKILIGGMSKSALETNHKCTYTLDNLERDYGLYMSPLGTMASSWTYNERQVGLTASQYIGISVMGTQKKVPCITQKQSIWNKWTNQPSRANPHVLNLYLGVQISHCTGNARRVKLRDVMAMKQIQSLLERQFPDWKDTEFGPSFQSALQSSSDQAIVDVWLKHYKCRSQMAELVCYVLELLDKTGMSAAGFTAALLNRQRELSVPLQTRLNQWVEFVEDSHLTAVYALIDDKCLIHKDGASTINHIALCTSSPFASDTLKHFTVFQTQLTVPSTTIDRDKIFLNQRGCLQRVSSTGEGVHVVTWESSRARELGIRLCHLLRSKLPSALSRELQDAGELGGERVQILVRSSAPSHGGLPAERKSNNKEASPAHLRNPLPSVRLEYRANEDDSLIMLEVGSDGQCRRTEAL